MNDERSCAWMSGPREGGEGITAARWWLAISRQSFSNEYLKQQQHRAPVTCNRTPTFVSPLAPRTK
ncbi:MAG TPA: hypothetical protein VM784_10135 [Actinomycetota bacterium]|nr:hypothetical protein [Actinomycetota bacterium]